MPPNDPFEGMDEAKVFERGRYMTIGRYTLRVNKHMAKDTSTSGFCFIAEYEVIESNLPEYAPGDTTSWVQSFTQKEIAQSAVKEYLAALYAIDTRQPFYKEVFSPNTTKATRMLCAESNPGMGLTVRLEVQPKVNKAGGASWQNRWSPGDGTPERFRALVAGAVPGSSAGAPPPPPPPPAGGPPGPPPFPGCTWSGGVWWTADGSHKLVANKWVPR